MGSASSCMSKDATSGVVQYHGENGEETDVGASRSLLFSCKKKNRGNGSKGKNKNTKSGGLPPKYQSCRDVLISTGHCECCGKRHLLGNALRHTLNSDSIADSPVSSSGKDPKVIRRLKANRQKTQDDILPDQPRSNESRPARQSPSQSQSSILKVPRKSSHAVKSYSTRPDYAADDACDDEDTLLKGDSRRDDTPDEIVDMPSGSGNQRECMLMNSTSDDDLSKMRCKYSSQQDYDHVKRIRHVGYVLGKNSGDLICTDGIGGYAFTDQFILQSRAPTVELVCLDEVLNIYACDLGLSEEDCHSVINAAEKCAAAAGRYSAYTYAKQTLGCRDYDDLALECIVPTHVACQTIRRVLGLPRKEIKKPIESSVLALKSADDNIGGTSSNLSRLTEIETDDHKNRLEDEVDVPPLRQESAPLPPVDSQNSIMVLDDREPHVVKYDTVDKTRQRLEMHTDKSEWTFLIALSEYGVDYEGGGTFFEDSRTTYHLKRGTCLIFPGKLKHCGRKISKGSRFLLVGFLVEKKREISLEEVSRVDTRATLEAQDEDNSKQSLHACSIHAMPGLIST